MGSLATGEEAGLLNLRNPLKGIRDGLRPVRRYLEVLHLPRVNGVTGRRPDPATLPAGVRQTLEQAGGILVKVGQVASTRADLLPASWREELAQLRSHAEPVPPDATDFSILRYHVGRADRGEEAARRGSACDRVDGCGHRPADSRMGGRLGRLARHDVTGPFVFALAGSSLGNADWGPLTSTSTPRRSTSSPRSPWRSCCSPTPRG